MFLKIFFLSLFFRGRKGGRRSSHEPSLGTWPTTQACALTANQTGDPLVRRPALSLLSHTSQGNNVILIFDVQHSDSTFLS